LPGAGSHDAAGFLLPGARTAFLMSFAPLAEAVHKGTSVKESTRKTRYGRIGLFGEFLKRTQLGPYIVETDVIGVFRPALDEHKREMAALAEFIAFYLLTMAHGGLARDADGIVRLVGAFALRHSR
jgi:hypothetical protein